MTRTLRAENKELLDAFVEALLRHDGLAAMELYLQAPAEVKQRISNPKKLVSGFDPLVEYDKVDAYIQQRKEEDELGMRRTYQ